MLVRNEVPPRLLKLLVFLLTAKDLVGTDAGLLRLSYI